MDTVVCGMKEVQDHAGLYLRIRRFLSGLEFFVLRFRVSFSIRERKPEIVVSVSVFPQYLQANRFCGRKNVESIRDNRSNIKPDPFVPFSPFRDFVHMGGGGRRGPPRWSRTPSTRPPTSSSSLRSISSSARRWVALAPVMANSRVRIRDGGRLRRRL